MPMPALSYCLFAGRLTDDCGISPKVVENFAATAPTKKGRDVLAETTASAG
jgi:hypothetical protein